MFATRSLFLDLVVGQEHFDAVGHDAVVFLLLTQHELGRVEEVPDQADQLPGGVSRVCLPECPGLHSLGNELGDWVLKRRKLRVVLPNKETRGKPCVDN